MGTDLKNTYYNCLENDSQLTTVLELNHQFILINFKNEKLDDSNIYKTLIVWTKEELSLLREKVQWEFSNDELEDYMNKVRDNQIIDIQEEYQKKAILERLYSLFLNIDNLCKILFEISYESYLSSLDTIIYPKRNDIQEIIDKLIDFISEHTTYDDFCIVNTLSNKTLKHKTKKWMYIENTYLDKPANISTFENNLVNSITQFLNNKPNNLIEDFHAYGWYNGFKGFIYKIKL